jgi:hypothetical protein
VWLASTAGAAAASDAEAEQALQAPAIGAAWGVVRSQLGQLSVEVPARAQQRWLDLAAADFFAATLRGARRPTWLRVGAPRPSRVYGRRLMVRRVG